MPSDTFGKLLNGFMVAVLSIVLRFHVIRTNDSCLYDIGVGSFGRLIGASAAWVGNR